MRDSKLFLVHAIKPARRAAAPRPGLASLRVFELGGNWDLGFGGLCGARGREVVDCRNFGTGQLAGLSLSLQQPQTSTMSFDGRP